MRGAHGHDSLLRAALLVALLAILSIAGVPAPASAEPVGSVSGTVRAAGMPVANAWVTVTPVTPTGDWAGRPVQTTTDRDGGYEVRDLYASHVKIQVRAPSFSGLASAYRPGAYLFASAGSLRVASSGSTGDVDLPVSALDQGRVVTRTPGARSSVLSWSRMWTPPRLGAGWIRWLTPGPGEFVIEGLPPVPITLQARAQPGSNHLGQWYDGAGFHGEAIWSRRNDGHRHPAARGWRGRRGRPRRSPASRFRVRPARSIGCPALCPMVAMEDDSALPD